MVFRTMGKHPLFIRYCSALYDTVVANSTLRGYSSESRTLMVRYCIGFKLKTKKKQNVLSECN